MKGSQSLEAAHSFLSPHALCLLQAPILDPSQAGEKDRVMEAVKVDTQLSKLCAPSPATGDVKASNPET